MIEKPVANTFYETSNILRKGYWDRAEDSPELISTMMEEFKFGFPLESMRESMNPDTKLNNRKFWYSTDSQENWEKNQQRQEEIESSGWLDYEITYDFNSYGFRNKEFVPEEDAIIILGDSLSFGTGLPREMTWPDMIEKRTGRTVFNLSLPMHSLDSSFRILYTWLATLKSKTVLMLENSPIVREIYLENVGSWSGEEWKTNLPVDPSERILSRAKNLIAIQAWCDMHGVELIVIDCKTRHDMGTKAYEDNVGTKYNIARDLMHPGINFHKVHTELFLEKLGDIN